jgi:alpha-L-arabinofuranosidase
MNQIFTMTILALLLSACAPLAPISASVAPTIFPTSTSLPTPTQIPTPIPDTLFVDPSISLGPISPLVYGSNYGPWLVVFFEMLPAAYDSGVTILRFPAGSWGDHNDVKSYQIDQFMDFAKKVGADALFSARLLDGTPEQAADMVRYTNIEKKYGVRYWNIGNEPTLYDGELKNRGETYDVKRFNEEWRTFAEAMKKVDPTIKLVGPEINQFSYDPTPGATTNFGERDETWMIEFLKANGDLVDVVSFHRYPFPRTRISGAPSIDELRRNAQEWDKIIVHARELIHEYTGRDLPIAITEFNSAYDKSFGGETTPDSHFNAIWMADVLGRMIKNGVFMTNQWYLTAQPGYGGLGLVGQSDVFPSYYTYQMYKEFGQELVYSSSDDPYLSIYAARRPDGSLTLIVINLSSEQKIKPLWIGDQAPIQAEVWLFDPTHRAENIGTIEISDRITVPPQSVSLYIIQ